MIPADTLSSAPMVHSLEFKWTLREANMAAHVLASWSLNNRLANCFVLGSAPAVLSDVFRSEQAFVLGSSV